MATEEGGGMEDVESELETPEERQGVIGSISDSLGDLKDKYVDFHTVEEESEAWGDQQVAGGLSRRGFLSLTGQAAVAGFGVAEATDGDGYAIDWSSGENSPAVAGPGTGNGAGAPAGNGNSENTLGVAGDVSDELYLQEDGTVIAIDYGHKEWRAFHTEDFPENEDLQGLYDDLQGQREPTDLAPPQLSQGIEVSQEEVFDYDTAAYDDMADEAEWDLIFDSNPNYKGGE